MPIIKINRYFHKMDPAGRRQDRIAPECPPLQNRFGYPLPFNIVFGEGLRETLPYSRFKENGH